MSNIANDPFLHVLTISHPKSKRVADSKICHAFRQLWQAFTYDAPHYLVLNPQYPYLSSIGFLPFLHKFNTFTFYTPYLLFLDQLQNEGKRGFSIRFQNQYIRGVYCQYPIFICFSTKR